MKRFNRFYVLGFIIFAFYLISTQIGLLPGYFNALLFGLCIVLLSLGIFMNNRNIHEEKTIKQDLLNEDIRY